MSAQTREPSDEMTSSEGSKIRELLGGLTPAELWDRFFDAYSSWEHKRAEKRAWRKNPRWREIEELRRAASKGGSTVVMVADDIGLTMDVWRAQTEILREITPHTIIHRIDWWLKDHPGVKHPIRTWQQFYQRGRRGWSDGDTFNLDTHMARVLSGAIEHFRETTMSHPTNLTPEEWDEILSEMASGFRAYGDDGAEDEETEERVNRSLELYQQWFLHLWK